MVNWPAIFKLEGDNELLFVNSFDELNAECESLIFSDGDVLIDSSGQGFSISFTDMTVNTVELIKLKRSYSLDEVTQFIQAHEFANANTCLIKIHFSSIGTAISALTNK